MSVVQPIEEFRVVAENPKYRVSNLGRVQRKKTPGKKTFNPDDFVWVDWLCHETPPGRGLSWHFAGFRGIPELCGKAGRTVGERLAASQALIPLAAVAITAELTGGGLAGGALHRSDSQIDQHYSPQL